MENSPAEVLHQICALLDPADAANLRLTSKAVAPVAEHYVFKGNLQFHLSSESLQRLQLFANHKVFSQKVITIYYEANILLPINNLQDFSIYFNSGSKDEPPPMPPSDPGDSRGSRLYHRNLSKWRQGDKSHSLKGLQEQLEEYKMLYQSQQEIIRTKLDIKTLNRVMKKFPKLAEVHVVNTGRCKHALSRRFLELFTDGFRPPMSFDTQITVRQLDSLLRPTNKSSLRVLNLKVVTPKVFSNISTKTSLVSSFANLHKLQLGFRLSDLEADNIDNEEPRELYRSIRRGYLRQALAKATKLREITIAFDDCCHHPHSFATLGDMLGDIHWKHLRKLDLSRFECSGLELVETLKRQPKLAMISLSCVTLSSGDWAAAFSSMRSDLSLVRGNFQGWLRSLEDEEFLVMDFVSIGAYEEDTMFTLSMAIDEYVTNRTFVWEDEDPEDYNPAKTLEEYRDFEELTEEMDIDDDSFSFDMLMTGMN